MCLCSHIHGLECCVFLLLHMVFTHPLMNIHEVFSVANMTLIMESVLYSVTCTRSVACVLLIIKCSVF